MLDPATTVMAIWPAPMIYAGPTEVGVAATTYLVLCEDRRQIIALEELCSLSAFPPQLVASLGVMYSCFIKLVNPPPPCVLLGR